MSIMGMVGSLLGLYLDNEIVKDELPDKDFIRYNRIADI